MAVLDLVLVVAAHVAVAILVAAAVAAAFAHASAAATFAFAELDAVHLWMPSPGLEALVFATDGAGAASPIAVRSVRGAFDHAAVGAFDSDPNGDQKAFAIVERQGVYPGVAASWVGADRVGVVAAVESVDGTALTLNLLQTAEAAASDVAAHALASLTSAVAATV